MPKETQKAFGDMMDRTTGVANRKLESWIDGFIEATANLDSPLIYRRWTAISTLAAGKAFMKSATPCRMVRSFSLISALS